MTSDQWQRVKALFNELMQIPAESRSAWIAEAVAGDSEVAIELATLIEAHHDAGLFLEESACVDPQDLIDADDPSE